MLIIIIINVQKISSDDQIVDVLIKSLGKTKFQKFRTLLGLKTSVNDLN